MRASRLSVLCRGLVTAALAAALVLAGATSATAAPAVIPAPDLSSYVVPPACGVDGSLTFTNNPPTPEPNGYEFVGQGFRVYLDPGYTGPGTYTATITNIPAGLDPAFPDGTTVIGPTTQSLVVAPAIAYQSTDPNAPCYTPPARVDVVAPDLTADIVAPTCTNDGTLTFLNNPPAQNPNGYEFPGEGYRVYLSPGFTGPGTYTATLTGVGPGFDPAFPGGTRVTGATRQLLVVQPAIGFQNTDPAAPCYATVEVTPPSPTLTPATCETPTTTIDVPAATTGVAGYSSNGTDVTDSIITLPAGGSATIVAVIATGYRPAAGATTSWSYAAFEPACATPVPPADEPATCTDTRTLVQIPAEPGEGVERYIDNATGETLTGTLYLTEGESITIDAVLEPGVELSPGASASWTYEYAGGCPDPGPITGGSSAGGDPDGLASTGPGPLSGLVGLTTALILSGMMLVLVGREARRITL